MADLLGGVAASLLGSFSGTSWAQRRTHSWAQRLALSVARAPEAGSAAAHLVAHRGREGDTDIRRFENRQMAAEIGRAHV